MGLQKGLGTNSGGHKHVGINENQMGDFLNFLTFPGETDHTVLAVQAGTNHACAITQTNKLFCWGDNSAGQLGQSGAASTTVVYTSPVKVNVPAGDLKQLALGRDHTCVLIYQVDQNKMFCWGSNVRGQLGMGLLTDALGSSALHTDSIIGNSASDQLVMNLPNVFVDNMDIKKIVANHLTTCVLFVTEKIRCYGKGDTGVIGIGTYDNNNDSITDDMGIRSADTGYKYLIDFGQDNITYNYHSVDDLFVGYDFACVVLDDARVKCWGNNSLGQLGLEDNQNRGRNNGEMGNSLPYVNIEPGQTVIGMSLGATHSCAVLANNKIKCWGQNLTGQLGIDADYPRGQLPFTMGISLPYNKVGF